MTTHIRRFDIPIGDIAEAFGLCLYLLFTISYYFLYAKKRFWEKWPIKKKYTNKQYMYACR